MRNLSQFLKQYRKSNYKRETLITLCHTLLYKLKLHSPLNKFLEGCHLPRVLHGQNRDYQVLVLSALSKNFFLIT